MKNKWNKVIGVFLSTLALIVFSFALKPVGQEEKTYDFAISKSFLEWLYSQHTIQPTLKIQLKHRTASVHTIDDDCEIHIAGMPEEQIGSPNDIVVEPPNLCKIHPLEQTVKSEKKLREEIWPQYLDDNFMNKTCEVTGFFRIFTEHLEGSQGPANPGHVFEIHPATKIKASNNEKSFENYLKIFDRMKFVKPETCADIISKKTLNVRYNSSDNQYEFVVSGKRGNFGIIEVGYINKSWIKATGGGHSTIARVIPDGNSPKTLKLYTLSGSDADKWLESIGNGSSSEYQKMLHGLFTLDYFAIIKTLKSEGSDKWSVNPNWLPVLYPIAFVVFGETETIPWEED